MQNLLLELSFRDLQILESLSSESSLRAISRKIGREPAVISKRLVQLEEIFGFEIAKRSSKGFVLTGEGSKICAAASSVLSTSQDLFATGFERRKSRFAKVLTVGGRGFLNILFSETLIRAQKSIGLEYRNRYIDLSPEELRQAAFAGVIDLAFHLEEMEFTSSWKSELVAPLTWKLFARRDHPLKSVSTIEQALEYPFIAPRYWDGRTLALGEDGFPVPWKRRIQGHEAQTAFNAMRILKCTDHVVLLPTLLAQDWIMNAELRLIELTDLKPIEAHLWLSIHKDRVSQKFLNSAREQIKRQVEKNS